MQPHLCGRVAALLRARRLRLLRALRPALRIVGQLRVRHGEQRVQLGQWARVGRVLRALVRVGLAATLGLEALDLARHVGDGALERRLVLRQTRGSVCAW